MKKVLLVYSGYIVREQPLNILYIGSAVHAAGHWTAFFDVTPFRKRPLRGDPLGPMRRSFEARLAAFKPDVVGFSVMSVSFKIAAALAGVVKAKEPCALNVFGGIHPTQRMKISSFPAVRPRQESRRLVGPAMTHKKI